MQSLEQKIIAKVQQAERLVEERYFSEWRKSDSCIEREILHTKLKVLKDLIRVVIHSIRGEKNG